MLRWLPEDVSPYGAGIDALFHLIYILTAIVFLTVTAFMLVFVFRYRAREGRRAVYTHGNTAVEILWTAVPAAIFIWLGLLSKSQWESIRMTMPLSDTMIRVTAKQFNWEILYPGPDGQFGTSDDKQVDNEIQCFGKNVPRLREHPLLQELQHHRPSILPPAKGRISICFFGSCH